MDKSWINHGSSLTFAHEGHILMEKDHIPHAIHIDGLHTDRFSVTVILLNGMELGMELSGEFNSS